MNDQAGMQVAGGQGTIALEMMAHLPRKQLDTVLVPVGGGGLISGMAACLKSADPSLRIIGCQPRASDVMAQSIAAGRVVDVASQDTLSDGTAGAQTLIFHFASFFWLALMLNFTGICTPCPFPLIGALVPWQHSAAGPTASSQTGGLHGITTTMAPREESISLHR